MTLLPTDVTEALEVIGPRHPRWRELAETRPEYHPAIVREAERVRRGAMGPLFAPAAIPPRGRDPSRRLVVAAYREDLAWLAEVPYEVIVYHKGANCPTGVPCVDLPNEKREAGSYLYHVVTEWDRLAPLTVFCQGNPFEHSPDFLERLSLPYDEPTSLSTRYKENEPADAVKALDLVVDHHGYEVRYGDATADHKDGSTGARWFDPKAWDHVFACPVPDPLWFGYGACWAVPREAIRRRGLAFYRWLLAECDAGHDGRSTTDPPLNPWTLEALWRYVWADPAEYPHREPELPPAWRQAAGLAGSVVAHAASGFEHAEASVVAARLAACEACPFFRPSDRRCGGNEGCGCYVDVNPSWAVAACPRRRWPE